MATASRIGFIDPRTEAIFGRSYAAEPGVLIEKIKKDEAIDRGQRVTTDRPQPTRCCLQYPCHLIDSDTRGAGSRVALSDSQKPCGSFHESARLSPTMHFPAYSLERSPSLSVAFTKEDSAETASEILLPDRPVSPHSNLVTEAGLKALELQLQ